MSNSSTRKVIHLGESRVISLPQGWLKSQGIETGDKVEVVEGSTALIVRKDEDEDDDD